MRHLTKQFLILGTLLVAFVCCNADKKREQLQAAGKKSAILKNQTAPAPSAPLRLTDELFDFTALAHNGQRLKLSEFLHKPVVIYFCPQDRAEICTQIALSLRDSWLSLNSELSMAFGVSTEDTVVHRDFSSTHKLPFLLLADTAASVHRVMGVKPGAVMGYLVGTDRRVQRVFQPIVPETFASELLRAIRTPVSAQPSAAPTTSAAVSAGASSPVGQ